MSGRESYVERLIEAERERLLDKLIAAQGVECSQCRRSEVEYLRGRLAILDGNEGSRPVLGVDGSGRR